VARTIADETLRRAPDRPQLGVQQRRRHQARSMPCRGAVALREDERLATGTISGRAIWSTCSRFSGYWARTNTRS